MAEDIIAGETGSILVETDGLGGPLVAGDHLLRDMHQYIFTATGYIVFIKLYKAIPN